MVVTVSDYGTFPIWHREADLFLLDLKTGEHGPMDINSSETDSFHSWSADGRWLVFSSRRIDGRSTRPYFTHIDSLGNQGKEFVLPQEDPSLYERMLESFNVPELVNGKIDVGPRDFLKATRQEAMKARSGDRPDTVLTPSRSEQEQQ
jgi:hypothetical protein